jgi:hypothetical protein
MPHMRPAEWDAMVYLMRSLAEDYPENFSLTLDGDRGHWSNRLLEIEQDFVVGDLTSLPLEPLEFIGRQVGEDIALLDQREGHLWVDSGLITFSAGWSFPFDVGMSFLNLHGPVPLAVPDGVFERAEQLLMRLQPGEVFRRLNWVMQGGDDLDVSLDSFPDWFPTRAAFMDTVSDDEFGERVNMRVELQHLIRLPSGAILFLIGTRFLKLADLARVPEWRELTANVVEELPEVMANYKGFSDLRTRVVEWLRAQAA